MDIVVVGSGAREDAWRRHFAGHGHSVTTVGGKAGVPGAVPQDQLFTPAVLAADLFIIGPEQPLCEGLADRLRALGKFVLGPGERIARLEGDKAWMKEIVTAAGVPTARYMVATKRNLPEVEEFIGGVLGGLSVVKTSYLAAGKGVTEHFTVESAMADIRAKLDKGEVVVEELFVGPEASAFYLCRIDRDGTCQAVFLGSAVDYKKEGEGDTGRNTGGTGAYSPALDLDPDEIQRDFVDPTLRELAKQGYTDDCLILFVGLMRPEVGWRLLEYNIRHGDPEAQCVLVRVESDLAQIILAALRGEALCAPDFSDEVAVTLVLCAEGYPGTPTGGDVIDGIKSLEEMTKATVCYAGTAYDNQGRLVTAGGRVLGLTVRDKDYKAARDEAYLAADWVRCRGMWRRPDIAKDVV